MNNLKVGLWVGLENIEGLVVFDGVKSAEDFIRFVSAHERLGLFRAMAYRLLGGGQYFQFTGDPIVVVNFNEAQLLGLDQQVVNEMARELNEANHSSVTCEITATDDAITCCIHCLG